MRKGSAVIFKYGKYRQRGTLVEVNKLTRRALVLPAHSPSTTDPVEVPLSRVKPEPARKERRRPAPRLPRIDEASPLTLATTVAALQPVPKPLPRLEVPAYRAYLSIEPCCACPASPCGGAASRAEVHHQGPRGVGRRAGDAWGVPLCRGCHRHLHQHGHLPERTPVESRELVLRTQVGYLLRYLEEQGWDRLRLRALLVQALEGELRLLVAAATRKSA